MSQHVGCDWIVDSDAHEDKCGICHGNGEQCDTIAGVYNKTSGSGMSRRKIRDNNCMTDMMHTLCYHLFSGYTEVVTIPSGARNIHIDEMGSSKNYIGIGSAGTERFYLNGKL